MPKNTIADVQINHLFFNFILSFLPPTDIIVLIIIVTTNEKR